MDAQGILSFVYCSSENTMKNYIAKAIWPDSFPDVAKLCFNCFVELVLAVSSPYTGDND